MTAPLTSVTQQRPLSGCLGRGCECLRCLFSCPRRIFCPSEALHGVKGLSIPVPLLLPVARGDTSICPHLETAIPNSPPTPDPATEAEPRSLCAASLGHALGWMLCSPLNPFFHGLELVILLRRWGLHGACCPRSPPNPPCAPQVRLRWSREDNASRAKEPHLLYPLHPKPGRGQGGSQGCV